MNNLTTRIKTTDDLERNAAGLITEFHPDFCKLFIEYSGENLRSDGFYAQYQISKTAADQWSIEHPEWSEAVLHGKYALDKLLNDNLKTLINVMDKCKDKPMVPPVVEAMIKIIMKVQDIALQIDKGSGALKDNLSDRQKITKNTNNTKTDAKIDAAVQNYLTQNKLDN